MTHQFEVSAPGQLYLFGELGITYGKLVILAGLNIRTFLKFAELPVENNFIIIEFPTLDIYMNLCLRTFRNNLLNKYKFDGNANLLLQQSRNYVEAYTPKSYNDNKKKVLTTVLYYLVYIANLEQIDITSFHVHMTTKLIDALGASGSISVCIVACYIYWSRLQKGVNVPHVFDEEDRRKIVEYATSFPGHSTSSVEGQIYTSVYGSMIKHELGKHSEVINMPIRGIILIDCKIEKNHLTQEKRLKNLMKLYPETVNFVLNNFHAISRMVYRLMTYYIALFLKAKRNENTNIITYKMEIANQQFESLTQMHQELINILEIQDPKMNLICSIANNYGFVAKSADTEGRYAYIWYPFDTTDLALNLLLQQLNEKGFNVLRTTLFNDGVKIQVLH